MHLHGHYSSIHNSQDMGTNPNVHQQMIGLGKCGIHNGILLNHKKGHEAICVTMNGTRDAHPQGNKSEREKQRP